jgi:hypothetical protein
MLREDKIGPCAYNFGTIILQRRRTVKEPLEFYDIKTKTKFTSADWRIETKESKGQTRYFAVARAPGGSHEAWRIVKADFGRMNM